MDYATHEAQRQHRPAWRPFNLAHAGLVTRFLRCAHVAAIAGLFAASGAGADPSRPGAAEAAGTDDGWNFKLTPSYYDTTHQKLAFDINLRANNGPHAFWIGEYRRGNEFEQTRAGYELTLANAYGRLIPSLQVASHGFHGGAFNLQIGNVTYALLGIGRTNAHDYYNLNFDPNDSTVLGLGTRQIPDTELLAYNVRDNRLHTDQSVTHLVGRYHWSNAQRLTLDIFQKRGRETSDAPMVSGNGVSRTYDYQQYFIRTAYDRKVNFTMDDQIRVAIGLRF